MNTKGVGKFTSIARDAYGIYISYYDDREVIYDPIHYDNCYINICERSLKVAFWNGVTWEIDQVDDYNDQGRVGLWSSLKVDFNGNLHIAYMSEKYDQLKYAFWNKIKDDWDRYTIDGEPPYLMWVRCAPLRSTTLANREFAGSPTSATTTFRTATCDWRA